MMECRQLWQDLTNEEKKTLKTLIVETTREKSLRLALFQRKISGLDTSAESIRFMKSIFLKLYAKSSNTVLPMMLAEAVYRPMAMFVKNISDTNIRGLPPCLKKKANQKVVEAKPIVAEITSSKQLATHAKGADLIICCADEPRGAIQSYVANAAVKAGTSALFGAVGINNGILGPLLKERSSFRAYLRWIREVRSVCKKTIVPARFPSNGITNSIMANLIAWEAFQYLANRGPTKTDACTLTLNFNSFEFTKKQVFK